MKGEESRGAGALEVVLSVVAHEITGAHWSGPRFFGLTAKKGARDG